MFANGSHIVRVALMAKDTWTKGHIYEEVLDKVLSDQYLSAMCIQDYIGSMSEKEMKKFKKTFLK